MENLVQEIGSPPAGSRWIHVFDRGADYFGAMCRIQLSGCDFVIRASKLNSNVFNVADEKVSLATAIGDAKILGSYELNLRSRVGVKARAAKIEVSCVRIEMPRPRHHTAWAKQFGIETISMNVVVVQEVGKVNGVKPIR